MSRYFYDYSMGGKVVRDEYGVVCADDRAAVDHAWNSLPKMMTETEVVLPWQHFELIVRREDGVHIGRVGITATVERRILLRQRCCPYKKWDRWKKSSSCLVPSAGLSRVGRFGGDGDIFAPGAFVVPSIVAAVNNLSSKDGSRPLRLSKRLRITRGSFLTALLVRCQFDERRTPLLQCVLMVRDDVELGKQSTHRGRYVRDRRKRARHRGPQSLTDGRGAYFSLGMHEVRRSRRGDHIGLKMLGLR